MARAEEYFERYPDALDYEPGPSLFSQARLLPAYTDGVFQGIRVSHLAPETYLESLGLQDGDLIVSVQGIPADEVARVPDALRALDAQPAGLRVGVIRAGERVVLTGP